MNAESTSTWKELANRLNDGLDVRLVWAKRDGKDEVVVRVTDVREGDTSRSRPSRRARSTPTTTRSPTGTSAQSTTAATAPRSPMTGSAAPQRAIELAQ